MGTGNWLEDLEAAAEQGSWTKALRILRRADRLGVRSDLPPDWEERMDRLAARLVARRHTLNQERIRLLRRRQYLGHFGGRRTGGGLLDKRA
jgi:hypothetical protein